MLRCDWLLFNSCYWCISFVAVPLSYRWSALPKIWWSNLWSLPIATLLYKSSFETDRPAPNLDRPVRLTKKRPSEANGGLSYGTLHHPRHYHSRHFHLSQNLIIIVIFIHCHHCLHGLIRRAEGKRPVPRGYHPVVASPYWTGKLVS